MKTQTQHTLDTWYVASTGNHQGLILSEKDGRNVAVAYDKADAPLIGAAPDLLEALRATEKAISDYVDYCTAWNPAVKHGGQGKALVELRDQARAAISKAEGGPV
jgi:hypothetical protein